MTNQDELDAKKADSAARHCLRTALGFEDKAFHVTRFESSEGENRQGVMIGISISRYSPDAQDNLYTLFQKVIQICKTA